MWQYNFYKIIIGCEIHINVLKNKLFSNNKSSTIYELSLPGVLPYLNYKIKNFIKLGFFTNFFNYSFFERKMYFCYDLPKNYQITQNIFSSIFNFTIKNYCNKKIIIKKIHIEEDSASCFKNTFFINYKRCSNSLLEIVTEPMFEKTKCLMFFFKKIFNILNIKKIKLNKGEFRVDINLSIINKFNLKKFKKIEIKNLNSFENIKKSIFYEINRQILYIEFKKKQIITTRGFNVFTFKIRKQNSKNYNFDIDYDLKFINYFDFNFIYKKSNNNKNIFFLFPKKKYLNIFNKNFFKNKKIFLLFLKKNNYFNNKKIFFFFKILKKFFIKKKKILFLLNFFLKIKKIFFLYNFNFI